MKVLFVCSLFYPHVGGVETTIEELCKYYQKNGIEVTVLTKRFPHSLKEKEVYKGIPIYRLISPKRYCEYLSAVNWLKENNSELRSDIIHVIGVRRPMPLFALLLSRNWRVPFVATFSGGDILNPNDPETTKLWREGKNIVPQSLLRSDWKVAFSKDIIKNVQKLIPKIGKIDLIYAGLDIAKIEASPRFNTKKPYLLSARRLYYSKGVDILIKAFSKIAKKYPNLNLYIIGNGPEETNLKQLVEEFSLQKRVKFLGKLDLSTTIYYLKGALINICPSRSEGGGIINFEAHAASCLAVGSSVEGIKEYIRNEKTGLTFESGNENDLAKTLEKALDNVKLRNKLVKTAKQAIKKYDWCIIANKYLQGYNKTKLNFANPDFIPWSYLSQNLWQKMTK